MNKKTSFNMIRTVILILSLIVFCSHNLYIRMDGYFLDPNQEVSLSLFNGTFEKSDNIISRDRILDASLVGLGNRKSIDPTKWRDLDSTITQINFNVGTAGTYVAGVSTKDRNIELTAEKFNSYLEHDGVKDLLGQRTNDGSLNEDVIENYQKHVKAIYQVGDHKSDDWKTILGYPIEFVPRSNPYESFSGEQLEVQLLLDGKPLANQLVYAEHIPDSNTHTHDDPSGHHHDSDGHAHEHSHKEHDHDHKNHKKQDHSHKHADHDNQHSQNHQHEHSHEVHDDVHNSHKESHDQKKGVEKEIKEHTHRDAQQMRTNEEGIITVNLPEDGLYYLRTIYMQKMDKMVGYTHQSKWATLSFAVTHHHDKTTHTHDHHDRDSSLPDWVFIAGSLLLIVLLFLFFRKK